jgi:regulator of protease activity HflC (stomatin/prohibitin superfamily)
VRPATPAPVAAPAAPEPLEDAGTQALSDALGSSFRIIKTLMILLVVAFLSSGVFTVDQNEVALVLRFGRPVGMGAEQLLKPGLHWAFPYPIDEVVRIPIGQSHTVTSTACWYGKDFEPAPGAPLSEGLPYLRPGVDGHTLTSDGNIIHARATLKYRIRPTSAVQYVFGFANVTNVIEHVLDNALIYASTQFQAEAALYRDQVGFADLVRRRVAESIERLELGIEVEADEIKTVAPLYLRSAFDAVVEKQQEASTKINTAQAQARSTTNNAIGQASAVISDGLTLSNQLVRTIAAEATHFTNQLPHFRSNPRLFQQRLLAESTERVLTNAQLKVFLPTRADHKPRELRLLLGRDPERPKPETTPVP